MANKNEIFGLVEYILSQKSSYLTGQNIILDGGYIQTKNIKNSYHWLWING